MNNKYSHLYLKNDKKSISYFDKSRAINNDDDNERISPERYQVQKSRLQSNWSNFENEISARHEKRNLEIPAHIDYVKIHFYPIFNDSSIKAGGTQKQNLIIKFRNKYGLAPVLFKDFNKTVLFAIDDIEKFGVFKNHLKLFYESEPTTDPHGTEYSLIINIHEFEFLTSSKIIKWFAGEHIYLELFDSAEIITQKIQILERLKLFLEEKRITYSFPEPNIIEIKETNREIIENIIDNFDIVHQVYSYQYKTRKPSEYGDSRIVTDFNLVVGDNIPKVAVLDTGVQSGSAISSAIENLNIDLTNPNDPLPAFDEDGHGTSVAGIIVVGQEYYKVEKLKYDAAAKVIPVKILKEHEGIFSLQDIEDVIRFLHEEHEVRIFNLSVVDEKYKAYNEPVSKYAYLLDKLTYEYDILICIATGNLNFQDIKDYYENPDESIYYPNHFYNPHNEGSQHFCALSNLHSPAESMNNITIGAIADNFEGVTDLSLDKSLPAYYSLKGHYDYSQKINNADVPKSVKNNNLFKPDISFYGGDALNENAGLLIFDKDISKLTSRSCGTSLAAPFAANLAAKIINIYPKINMQTVKALIINSATKGNATFLDEHFNNLKEQESQDRYGKTFDELDTRTEKRKVNELYNSKNLYNRLAGHGLPNENDCLYSSDNEVVFVIEDTIKADTQQVTTLKLPQYLQDKVKSQVLTVSATLCYKFNPVFENQLAYNPVHIAFKFTKKLDEDLQESIKKSIIPQHIFYEQFYEDGFTDKQKAKKRKEVKEIKTATAKWSEDFFPVNTSIFSNVQKLSFIIQKKDLVKVDNTIALLIRATIKNEGLDSQFFNSLKETEHELSLVISIKEKDPDNENSLIEELLNDNICSNITEIETELDIENTI